MKFFKNQIDRTGRWHLYDKDDATCLCGIPVSGENHHEIPIERREVCYCCHCKAKQLAKSENDNK